MKYLTNGGVSGANKIVQKLLPNTLRRLMIFGSEIFGPKHLASPHEVCGRLEDL